MRSERQRVLLAPLRVAGTDVTGHGFTHQRAKSIFVHA
jgi:hypothetical protein